MSFVKFPYEEIGQTYYKSSMDPNKIRNYTNLKGRQMESFWIRYNKQTTHMPYETPSLHKTSNCMPY